MRAFLLHLQTYLKYFCFVALVGDFPDELILKNNLISSKTIVVTIEIH